MTLDDYEIQVGKSLIAAGNSCFSGAVVGLVVTTAETALRLPSDSADLLFILFSFGLAVVVGIHLRNRGLRKLKNLIRKNQSSEK